MRDEVEALIKDSAEDLTVWTNEAVERLLSQFEHQALFDAISNYMNNPAVGRREWIICIKTLCQIDRNEANKRFVQALQTDDADKRFRVVKLLGGYGSEHIVPTLITMLREDPEPDIRYMVAVTLGAIGDRRALPALEWSAKHDHAAHHDGDPVSYMAEQAIERIEKKDQRGIVEM